MNHLTHFGKVLTDINRVRIITLLMYGELCVCELIDALQMTQSTLSSHLMIIKRAGLVDTRKNGKWIYYSLIPPAHDLLTNIFQNFHRDLSASKEIIEDRARLAERLEKRQNGCCVVGTQSIKPFKIGGMQNDTIETH